MTSLGFTSPDFLPSLGESEEGSVRGAVRETAEGDVLGGSAVLQELGEICG